VVNRDSGPRATRRCGERDLRSVRDVARRVDVPDAGVEVLVRVHAPLIVALARQSLREVIGGVVTNRDASPTALRPTPMTTVFFPRVSCPSQSGQWYAVEP
jgi:hypothetical protein